PFAMAAIPLVDARQDLIHSRPRLPAGVARKLAVIGDIDELIAGARLAKVVARPLAGELLHPLHELQQGTRVPGPPADVVDLSRRHLAPGVRRLEGAEQVCDMEN